jgi:hypothetical protein
MSKGRFRSISPLERNRCLNVLAARRDLEAGDVVL